MRDRLATELRQAQKGQDKRRVSTLRLIQAAITDRDIANRGQGKPAIGDEDITQVLAKMVKQREESAKAFEDGGRAELAAQERDEIEIIRGFLPRQMDEAAMRSAVAAAIAGTGAEGLRDMGKVMAELKSRHPGAMDFTQASALVRETLK